MSEEQKTLVISQVILNLMLVRVAVVLQSTFGTTALADGSQATDANSALDR